MYTCVARVKAGKAMYVVNNTEFHECARRDTGGRAALTLDMVAGKLHRFVDTSIKGRAGHGETWYF